MFEGKNLVGLKWSFDRGYVRGKFPLESKEREKGLYKYLLE